MPKQVRFPACSNLQTERCAKGRVPFVGALPFFVIQPCFYYPVHIKETKSTKQANRKGSQMGYDPFELLCVCRIFGLLPGYSIFPYFS
jgi:hypothetical protein